MKISIMLRMREQSVAGLLFSLQRSAKEATMMHAVYNSKINFMTFSYVYCT